MKNLVLALALVCGLVGCKGKAHDVKFVVDVVSNAGEKPLTLNCYEFSQLEDYVKELTATMMAGKPGPKEPEAVAKFATPGKPLNPTEFTLQLPEKELTCFVAPMKAVDVMVGGKRGEVFKPKGASTIKVKYNMHTNTLYNVEQSVENVDVIK